MTWKHINVSIVLQVLPYLYELGCKNIVLEGSMNHRILHCIFCSKMKKKTKAGERGGRWEIRTHVTVGHTGGNELFHFMNNWWMDKWSIVMYGSARCEWMNLKVCLGVSSCKCKW